MQPPEATRMTSEQIYADGWYKVSHGNVIYVREFVGGLSSAGTEIEKYIKLGYTLEPMVVLTPAEYRLLTGAKDYIDQLHEALDSLGVRDEVDQEMVRLEDEDLPIHQM